jgi:uncharacterized protein
MLIEISSIPEDGLQQELELPVKVNQHTDTAHVLIKISKLGKMVFAEGSVKISATLTCSRCLKDYPYPLDLTFNEEYTPAGVSEEEKEYELTEEELNLDYYSDEQLDINELITEQILLAVPMKPLCSPECPGLCPACGKDMNEAKCNCNIEQVDPRLQPLERLKEKMKERKE